MKKITCEISGNGAVESKFQATSPVPHVHQSTTTTTAIPTNITEQERSPAKRSGIGLISSSSPEKRKRGRPKKYGSCPRGTLILRPPVIAAAAARVAASVVDSVNPPPKRGRGRPKGSTGRWKDDSQGFLSIERIEIHPGEDIAAKITSYAKNTSKAILVLTACGSVSSVVFQHPFSSRGLIKHEGNFQIVKLNGSFCMNNTGRKTGKLAVTLVSESDHRMFGGAVGGPLLAALPVEIMIGSFAQETRRTGEPSASTRRINFEEIHRPVPLRVTLAQFEGYRFQRGSATTPPTFESEACKVEQPENPNSAFVSDLLSSPETLDDLLFQPPVPGSDQMKESDGKM